MELFDLHCDTVYECEAQGVSLKENALHLDMRRGSRYAPWLQVLAVWMPDTLRGEAAFARCMAVIDYAHREAGEDLYLVQRAADLSRKAACLGLLAVEGGSALAGDIRKVAALAARGVRVLTLTWNGSNELGHGSLSGCADGLTPFGKQVVAACEANRITVDVSHLNEAGFWDVAEGATRPYIASHSGLSGVHPHPRNLTDAQLAQLCRCGGLVGINFCKEHLGEQSPDGIYRHLEYGLSRGGEKVLALGGDLDGTALPETFGGVAFYEALADYLAQKGYSQALIRRIFFQNALNFFSGALQSQENEVK